MVLADEARRLVVPRVREFLPVLAVPVASVRLRGLSQPRREQKRDQAGAKDRRPPQKTPHPSLPSQTPLLSEAGVLVLSTGGITIRPRAELPAHDARRRGPRHHRAPSDGALGRDRI